MLKATGLNPTFQSTAAKAFASISSASGHTEEKVAKTATPMLDC